MANVESSTNWRDAQDALEVPGRYFLGPFCFLAELDLPELPRGIQGRSLEVEIRLGAVARPGPDLRPLDEFCSVSPRTYLLDIPLVARYLVEDGRRVTVDLYPEAREPDVRGYLLGSVFGALCHQNGFLPLHASAVLGVHGVTAFLGQSGAGKSTTAAFLEQRGYRVISDDICLLDLTEGAARVIPVAGWLKLWQESFDRLGEAPAKDTRVFSASDKFRRYLAQEDWETPVLSDVVFLEVDQELTEPVLERASAARSIAGLMQLTYLSYIPELNSTREAHLAQISEVLRHARAWRLRRPWGWDALPEALSLVEARLLQDTSLDGGKLDQP
jgi:dephospho-CoA kinase